MIVEWFVQFILGIVSAVLDWLPETPDTELPDLGPLLGLLHASDVASAGFVSESFAVIGLLLTVNGTLFLFALLRQVWRFLPVIGGG